MNRSRVEVEARPQSTVSTPAQTTIGTTAAQLIAATTNEARRSLVIQNTGTTTIKLAFGATSPTQSVYHVALKACGIADDGSGGIYADDAWRGAVQVISSGAGGTVVVTEFTF